MIRADRSIADYDRVMDPIRAARQAKSGNQPGDPAKAAQVLLKLVTAENPPVRLYLGPTRLKLVAAKIEAMRPRSPHGRRFPAPPISRRERRSAPCSR